MSGGSKQFCGSTSNSVCCADITKKVAKANTTTELEIVTFADFCAAKYLVCVFNNILDKYETSQIFVSRVEGLSISDTVYSKLGGNLNVQLNFTTDGSEVKFEIVNGESFDVTVHFVRTII